MKLLGVIFLLGLTSTSAFAHHGRIEFGNQVGELRGEIVDIDWRQPHPAFSISVVDERGESEIWLIESFAGVGILGGPEVAAEIFTIGSHVVVSGRPSTRRSNYFLGTNVLLEDGSEAVLGAMFEPIWSENFIGGRSNAGQARQVVDAAKENRGIFRIWSISERGVGRNVNWTFTDAAIAARTEWDPLDNPIFRCEQPGMPAAILQPVSPIQFIDAGDTIEFRARWFGTVRTIHMGDGISQNDQPSSPLGFSVGRWEGNTLVIETTRIDWPYFNTVGISQSEAMRITERYTLSDDQTRLDQHVTFVDPMTFTGPATYEKFYMALGDSDMNWECRVL